MSRSVDERIVDMQFNNQQFESGIKQSLGSLDQLKKGLQLDGAGKGLNNLAEGVETIASRFTNLGIIGVTALQNITNKVIDLGLQMAKSLTLDQVTAGWTKYEQKTASIQTIMNATGKSIDEVNGYLDKLMWFSDETSYGFTDMTSALAQMTSSGGDVENLLPLITGVANATAYAGKGAAEFSRAMYNLNQSYGSGNLQYMDWRSLELAGVASRELKQIFIDTGVAMGKIAEGEVTIGNFGTTLQKKWADTSVMEAAFGKFSELSEEAYRLVQAGEYDTAAEAMEALSGQYSDVAEKAFKSAQQAKTFTEAIDATKDAVSTGWMKTMEIIFGNIEEATVLWTDVTNALWDVFASGAEARNEMLQGWKDLGGRDALIESFWNLMEAIEKIVTPIKEAFRDIFPATTAERLFALTEGLKAFTEKLKIGEETAAKIKRSFAGFFAVLNIGKQAISAIAGGIGRLFKALAPGSSSFLDFTAGVGDWLVSLDAAIKKGDIFNKVIGNIADVIGWVSDKIGNGVKAIIGFFKGFDDVDLSGVESFTDRIRIRFEPFSALFEGIGKIFSNTVEILKKVAPLFYKLASMIGKGIVSLQDRILEALDNGDFSSILDVINTGLLGSLILGIKKFVNSMLDVTGGFTGILDGVKESLKAWQSSLKAGILLQIAISIGILAAALAVLAMIDSNKLTVALATITTLFVDLFGSLTLFTKIMEGSGFNAIGRVTRALLGISVAVLILSFAMSKIAKLDWDEITKGLVSIGALMGMLVAVAKLLSGNTAGMMKGAAGFILFAVAINILASAVKKLGAIDLDDLGKGLLSVAVLMGSIAGFTQIVKPEKLISTGIGMTAIGAALVIIASAVNGLGSMDLENLAKGVGALAVILATIAGFTQIIKAEKLMSTGIAMIAMGAAIAIIANSIGALGGMDLLGLATGLGTLALILAMIAGFTQIVKAEKMLAVGAAMLIMSVALGVMTNVLQTLGAMPLAEIGKGLLALAGIFVVVGLAGLVLAPILPAILGLSAAIALLGIGVLALGAGLLLFSAAMTALAVSGAAGTAALVGIVTALIGLIPFLLEQIGYAIIAFCEVIIQGMPAIMEAIRVLFAGLIELFVELTPPLVESILAFLLDLLVKLVDYTPEFVDAGMKLMIGFLKGIADNISELVQIAYDVVLNFLDGISKKIPDVIDMSFKLIISFIDGLAEAIRKNHEAIYDASENLVTAMIEAITSMLTRLPETGKNIVNGLIKGVTSMGKALSNALKGIVNNSVDGVKKLLGIHSPSTVFEKIGENTDKGMIIGLKKLSGKVGSAAEDVGKTTVDSMSEALRNVEDILNRDAELQPTIRPVIDMTDVESGLNSTFSKQQGINVDGSINRVSKIVAQRQNGGDPIVIDKTTDNTDSKIEIHNHYTVRNDNDIRKISRDQRNLLDRYSLAKGVPVPS